jgi:glycosyltransferase involved in cell wall biosynthesis
VSFIVAARNAERTIEAALRSLSWQTVPHWEAIVVDDGSTDATAARARAVPDARVRVVELDEHRGRSFARNTAIDLARGRFLAIQDADDISHPRRLEVLLELIASRPGCGVASGQHAYFEYDGDYRASLRWPMAADEIRAGLLRGRMTVCHGASLIESRLVRELGGYDEACVRAQDLNLFMRAATVTAFAVSDRILIYYRHPRVVPFRYLLENNRYREIAIRRARSSIQSADLNGNSDRPRPGWRTRALLSYARYALRQGFAASTRISGPEREADAPFAP